jgi:hypothetical protein
VLGHVGNNEAVAAGGREPRLADQRRRRRLDVPRDVRALPPAAEAWGVHVIPWRNLREIYAVLRRREMLAL